MQNSEKALEKRLGRIERWLKRCMAACKCGSWSSALMEIECMEAETRGFREDLWKTVEDEACSVPKASLSSRIFFLSRVAVISLIIVMAVGIPLAVEQDRPFGGFDAASIAVLTSTESEILGALRNSLSSANEGRVLLSVEVGETPVSPPAPTGAAMASEERVDEEPEQTQPERRVERPIPQQRQRVEIVKIEPAQPETRTKSEPSVEEVLSLLQIGQKALRISEPAVRVIE